MKKIKGVFFELDGALLTCERDPAYQERAWACMARLAGRADPKDFAALVEECCQRYRRWALAENREAGDFELWDRWLLPELDKERLAAVCHELTWQYRRTQGRRRVAPGGLRVVRRLYERGYRLGIVSNLIGEEEIPSWLREDGLTQYFDAVVLSSVCHIRKPDPRIYRLGCDELGLEPEECAGVTGGPEEDAAGAAGLGAGILLADREAGGGRADYVVRRLPEILDLPILR